MTEDPKEHFIHRDDIDMDVMQALEKAMKKDHGEHFKVVCLGDTDEIPPEVMEQLAGLKKKMDEILAKGLCWDCGKQMPNWPPPDDENEEWDQAEGWATLNSMEGGEEQITGWICPECDKNEGPGFIEVRE